MKHKSDVLSKGFHYSEENGIIFTLIPYYRESYVQISLRPDYWHTTTFKNKQQNHTPTTSESIDSPSAIVATTEPSLYQSEKNTPPSPLTPLENTSNTPPYCKSLVHARNTF
jgi:hypothetical protein